MSYKMTADQRRREWAKLAVLASKQTGDVLPTEVYELARETGPQDAAVKQPASLKQPASRVRVVQRRSGGTSRRSSSKKSQQGIA